MQKIKYSVVAFDAYGTCFDINSASKMMKKELGKKWFKFSTLWRSKQIEYTWLRSLMNKHKDFEKITKDSLDYTCNVFKINNEIKSKLINFYKILSPYPDLKKTLINLKNKNIKTCILSNGTKKQIDLLVKNAKCENLFDDIFSIESVKIYKPSPKVYSMITKKYKCKSNQVCFISSNTWDAVGGGVFGFKTFWINRNNKQFDNLDYKPHYSINALSDLNKLIK